MKFNLVAVVNGYEIYVQKSNSGYPYWVQVGKKWNDTKSWKTLKGAMSWCEKH